MQFSFKPANILLSLALIAGLNTATASVVPRQTVVATVHQCGVAPAKGGGLLTTGNTWAIRVTDVNVNSQSTICDHSGDFVANSARELGIDVNESKITCYTDDNLQPILMGFTVTLDKQSTDVQLQALVAGINLAFGTAKDVFDAGICDLSNLPV